MVSNLLVGRFPSRSLDTGALGPIPNRLPRPERPSFVAELEKALLLAGKPMVVKAEEVTETKGASKKKLIDKIGQASKGQADDLKQIKGIGPKLENMLNELGVFTYQQISKLTAREYDMIDELLGTFQGRAKRDEWAKQAKTLL